MNHSMINPHRYGEALSEDSALEGGYTASYRGPVFLVGANPALRYSQERLLRAYRFHVRAFGDLEGFFAGYQDQGGCLCLDPQGLADEPDACIDRVRATSDIPVLALQGDRNSLALQRAAKRHSGVMLLTKPPKLSQFLTSVRALLPQPATGDPDAPPRPRADS